VSVYNTDMKTEVLRADHPVVIPHAVDILKHGGLIAFPTDTVYGLAALPKKAEFVERLYSVKGRNSSRAIAILIGNLEDLENVADSPGSAALRLAARFWPGPLTVVVPRHKSLPDILSTNHTIGVRMPDHPVALALLSMSGPLAVTSANLSGGENTLTAQDVLAQLNGRVHLVIDGGRVPGGVPSSVVDCTTEKPNLLRVGPISLADILEVLSRQ
jgi:L-threonylcarbamoyladenylate synthase